MASVRQVPLIGTANANSNPAVISGAVTGTSSPVDTSYLARKSFYVATTGFTGTLDLQGSWDGGVTWKNLLYNTRATTGLAVATQLSYTADTATYIYTTDDHVPLIQVVMTRVAGSVAVSFFGNENMGNLPGERTSVAIEATNGGTSEILHSGDVTNLVSDAGLLDALMVGQYNASAPTITDTRYNHLQIDVNGNLKVTQATKLSGEDQTADVIKTEERYTIGAVITADTQVKAGAGYILGFVVSCNDAAPTAGSLIVYNSLTETGTQLFNHTFTITPFSPFFVPLRGTFDTGLYFGFTTTADVNVVPIYR